MPLKRSLGFGVVVLYGIGTTIGAGIYALVGEIVAVAGWLAPWSFVVASVMAGLTALSFCELTSRMPRAAGTALFVERGLGSAHLARLVGYLVIASGTVSSAALISSLSGYVQIFAAMPEWVVVAGVVGVLTLIALWGIAQSAWLAALVTVLEVGCLLWIVALCVSAIEAPAIEQAAFVPTAPSLLPIMSGAILSFYAYIGFEDMVEIAEEVKSPSRNLPRAILTTLVATSIIYLTLLCAMLLAVGPEFLASSAAPMADVYQRLTGSDAPVIGAIAIFAIVNGALIQIIMASRVAYGLASRRQLPPVLARTHPRRQTPTVATLIVAGAVLALALTGRLGGLAETTSVLMLCVFALANLALWRLHRREPQSADGFRAPAWVPPLGFLVCVYFAVHSLSAQLA